jgi:hypothetical protein
MWIIIFADIQDMMFWFKGNENDPRLARYRKDPH